MTTGPFIVHNPFLWTPRHLPSLPGGDWVSYTQAVIPLPPHEKLLAWEDRRSVNQGRPRAELFVLPLLLWWSPKSFWKVLWERWQSLAHSARPAGCRQGGWSPLLAFSHRAGRLLKRDTCLKLFIGSTKKIEWICVSALALLLLYGPVRNAGRVFMPSLRLRQLRLRSVREPSPEPRASTQRLESMSPHH